MIINKDNTFSIKSILQDFNKYDEYLLKSGVIDEDFIKKLFKLLVKNEFLETEKGLYRFAIRRTIELDTREDVTNATMFQVQSLPAKEHDIDNNGKCFHYHILITAHEDELAVKNNSNADDLNFAKFPNSIIKEKLDIGRHPENDIQTNDFLVSRFHVRFLYVSSRWYLHDMNTANGTLINGSQIKNQCLLQEGDVIQIGKTKILFKIK
jgi:hypothetical protein